MKNPRIKDLISIRQASQVLNMKKGSVHWRIKNGDIGVLKIDDFILCYKTDVQKLRRELKREKNKS